MVAVDSEVQLFKGLAAIVLSALFKKSFQEVTAFNIEASLTDIDLFRHLNSILVNGLRAMFKNIRLG